MDPLPTCREVMIEQAKKKKNQSQPLYSAKSSIFRMSSPFVLHGVEKGNQRQRGFPGR